MKRIRRTVAAALAVGALALGTTLPAEAATKTTVTKGGCSIKISKKLDWRAHGNAVWSIHPKKEGPPTIRPELFQISVVKPLTNKLVLMDEYTAHLQRKLYDKNGKVYYSTMQTVGSGADDIVYDWMASTKQKHINALEYPTWLITVKVKDGGKSCTMRTSEPSW